VSRIAIFTSNQNQEVGTEKPIAKSSTKKRGRARLVDMTHKGGTIVIMGHPPLKKKKK